MRERRKNDLSNEEIKERIRDYWDGNPERYDGYPGFGTASEIEAWKRFFSIEFKDEKLKILDVGTGTGFLSLTLAELGHDVVGVDLSEGMLSAAGKKAEERRLNLDLRIGDAESLDLEDESFDAVVSRWVLWTLPDPEYAVREWRRVVKPGGKVCAFTTDFSGIESGMIGWIKRNLAMFMILIIERTNEWARSGYGKGVEEKLPLCYDKPDSRVDNKVKLFEKCELDDVTAIEMKEVSRILNEELKKTPLRYKLAWSGPGDWYCVRGNRR